MRLDDPGSERENQDHQSTIPQGGAVVTSEVTEPMNSTTQLATCIFMMPLVSLIHPQTIVRRTSCVFCHTLTTWPSLSENQQMQLYSQIVSKMMVWPEVDVNTCE